MALIPYPDLDKISPEAREMLGRLPSPANIFNMMAHAQTALKPVMKLGGTLLGKLELDPKLRELCLLQAVKVGGGEYEWVQHVPIALALGATQAQIDALEKGDDKATCFDAAEQAALAFTRELVTHLSGEIIHPAFRVNGIQHDLEVAPRQPLRPGEVGEAGGGRLAIVAPPDFRVEGPAE